MNNIFSTSDLITKVREYQEKNTILKEKSHHFVFDCPFNKTINIKPSFIWIGVNPGADKNDWAKTNYKNSEETRDYDFQEECGRSEHSEKRMNKVRKFLGNEFYNITTHTELFFWCSDNTTSDFAKRYGTSFKKNSHLEFCIKLNKKLIDRIKPKAIFFESIPKLSMISDNFKIELKNEYLVGTRKIIVYLLENKYTLINFDHLSALGDAIKYRPKVSELVRKLIS